jgi:ZIP family zinc transporter
LAFELTREAYETAGTTAVISGLAGGAMTFFVGDWSTGRQAGAGTAALVLGALLDRIRETVAIGVSLLGGGSVGCRW